MVTAATVATCDRCGRRAPTQSVPDERQIERILARQPNAEIFVFELCPKCR